MDFFIFNRIKTQDITRIIAIKAFNPDEMIALKSPKPSMDMGAIAKTSIPPPKIIKAHIKNMKVKIGKELISNFQNIIFLK